MSDGAANNTSAPARPPVELTFLGLLLVPCSATVGNVLVLVCIAVNHKIRANCTNHYIASLAASDFLIGSLVMPFAVYLMVNHGAWLAGETCCQAYLAIDVAASTASILNLLLIATDRFVAIMKAATYQQTFQNLKKVRLVIISVWVLSGSLVIPLLLNRKPTPNEERCDFDSPDFMIYSSLMSFYVPALTILTMYGIIFRHLKKRVTHSLVMRNRHSTNSLGDSLTRKNTSANARDSVTDSEPQKLRPQKNCMRQKLEKSHNTNSISTDQPSKQSPHMQALQVAEGKPAVKKRCIRRHTTSNIQVNNTGKRLSLYHMDNESVSSTDSEEDRMVLRAGMGMSKTMQARKLVRRVTSGITTRFSLARKSSSFRKEKKATKLVAIVVGCFLACWLPFFTMQMFRGICLKLGKCNTDDDISAKLFLATTWLGYLNSALNPILYTVFNEAFREGMKRLLTCQCTSRPISL